MKKYYLFLMLTVVITQAVAQTFNTGTLTLTFNDPLRTGGFGSGGGPGRQIQTEIYYPATVSGSNVALASGSFPVVVFGHGFVMDWSSYDNIYSLLSKRGYIVALPRTEGSASPSHSDFGADLAIVAQKMLALNATNTVAPVFTGKVLQKAAIGGHSMGGGSSFLAAKNNTTIACVFNFAAAETNPKSSSAAKFVTVPTLIIGGERDCVAAPSGNQDKMYDSCLAAKKFEVILKKLTHCDFGNGTNSNCLLGQNLSFCGSQVSSSVALNQYMAFVNPFLDHLLKSDCAAGNRFMDSVNLSPVIFSKKQTGTLACFSAGIDEWGVEQVRTFPNPLRSDKLKVMSAFPFHTIEISDVTGRIHIQEPVENSEVTLEVSGMPSGMYFIVLRSERGTKVQRLIKE